MQVKQNKEEILQKIRMRRISFFAIIASELSMVIAFTYIKFAFFQETPNWWLGIIIFPALIATILVLNKICVCPNCNSELVGPDGIKLFDGKCENCGTEFSNQ